MSDENPTPGSHDPGFTEGFAVKAVYCKRLDKQLPVAEHADCVYCHGDEEEIKTAEHERFCEFDPDKDPVHFGFPEGTSRDLEG
jgi:hypothetical protein